MPATDPHRKRYETFKAQWRGIDLTIRHCTGWSASVGLDHIEVISAELASLPITETGYKSHFLSPEQIAEFGTPVEYTLAWLDHEANCKTWKRREQDARQLSLF